MAIRFESSSYPSSSSSSSDRPLSHPKYQVFDTQLFAAKSEKDSIKKIHVLFVLYQELMRSSWKSSQKDEVLSSIRTEFESERSKVLAAVAIIHQQGQATSSLDHIPYLIINRFSEAIQTPATKAFIAESSSSSESLPKELQSRIAEYVNREDWTVWSQVNSFWNREIVRIAKLDQLSKFNRFIDQFQLSLRSLQDLSSSHVEMRLQLEAVSCALERLVSNFTQVKRVQDLRGLKDFNLDRIFEIILIFQRLDQGIGKEKMNEILKKIWPSLTPSDLQKSSLWLASAKPIFQNPEHPEFFELILRSFISRRNSSISPRALPVDRLSRSSSYVLSVSLLARDRLRAHQLIPAFESSADLMIQFYAAAAKQSFECHQYHRGIMEICEIFKRLEFKKDPLIPPFFIDQAQVQFSEIFSMLEASGDDELMKWFFAYISIYYPRVVAKNNLEKTRD